MVIEGVLRKDRRTKRLIARLRPGDIALIAHQDIDPLAAQSLADVRVAAVLNAEKSFSGRVPTTGTLLLLEKEIPVIDLNSEDAYQQLRDGRKVRLEMPSGRIFQDQICWQGTVLHAEDIRRQLTESRKRFGTLLEEFAENTLQHIKADGRWFLYPEEIVPIPEGLFAGRTAVVVTRGTGYREDLKAISNFLRDKKPVLIAVDGGADALLDLGFRPDFIVGDMDSLSERALHCGAQLIVHAYPDGRAPGLKRLETLGLKGTVFPIGGTSEDAAYILAERGGADLIVAVGSRFSALEFLEKGRKGMASTFLVRLRVGDRLVDAKGVRALYSSGLKGWHLWLLLAAGAFASGSLAYFSPGLWSYVRTLWLWVRTTLEQLWLHLT
ncbi:MAG: putative cytokinetic ring protein SteA [Armatimonadetes bacterium]|nr:putative cytokinetic ring protein SteA [Armatimonadota bacterium]MDW8121951.1 putative cytokinetic ring protein SteA [Armatimonadota bacterium]